MNKKLKNKKIKYIFGLILLITLNFTPLSFINVPMKKSNSDLLDLKRSGVFYDIEIDDLPGRLTNWSWAATQPWFGGGSGTVGDPYLIEDHTFEYSSGAGNCFSIFNSIKDFIINNCTFKNSDLAGNGLFLHNVTNGQITNNQMINNHRGIHLNLCNDTSVSDNLVYDNNFYGILLDYSHFNTISENNASFNDFRGIRLYQSTFNTISENTVYDNGARDGIQLQSNSNNNTVSRNIVSNSGDHGIEIYINSLSNIITENTIINHIGEGIYIYLGCNYNLLYENILKNNGLHAVDDGLNNNWNITLIGNYWDNYTGYDMDLDGIGDTPYLFISGSAGSIDYLPIWNIQSPIAIDDLPSSLNNWTWAASQPWFGGGSGTELDPYIIEDLYIDGGGTGNCLSIENSIRYFIIQECTLTNSGSTMTDAGVYLSNVTNGQILSNLIYDNYHGMRFSYVNDTIVSDNNVTNNAFYGFYITNSYSNNFLQNNVSNNGNRGFRLEFSLLNNIVENLIEDNINDDGILLTGSSHNNTISGNIITNNGDISPEYGIDIAGSSSYNTITGNIITDHTFGGIHLYAGCNNNFLYENIFLKNGIHAVDDGSNNNWNITLIGNYWDNYTGYDMDLDGIGDTPYLFISGSAGSIDYLPIWNIQSPIAIDDFPGSLNNWTWAASQPWFGGGSGTELDPYIIKDLTIDAKNTDNCISILNSRAFFTIRNCILYRSAATYAGIYLFNVTNGNIANNQIDNNYVGLYLEYSNFNTISENNVTHNSYNGIHLSDSHNNTIIKNNANHNGDEGIFFYYSDNNTIQENTAYNNSNNGIRINWSGNNYVLENNATRNTGTGNDGNGIRLYDAVNNTIINNYVTENNMNGILLLFVSNDNIIYDNDIHNNVMDGIHLATGSDYNLIYRNFFWGNGRHAFDDGSNNDWNSTTIGNCWDNHTGPDMNDDGIVDNPYTYIGGSAGSIDYLPIAEDGPPSIIINSPSEDDVFGTSAPSFSVTITDNFLDETWYTLDGGLHNYTFTGSTGTMDQSAWDVMPDGTITLTIYASDLPGNISSAEVNIEKDSQAPIIVINSPFEDDVFGTSSPSFNVTITDNSLDETWYTLDGGLHNYIFTGSTGTINQSAWDAMPDGTITLTFYASDIPGNISSAEVNIEKNSQAPIIVIISPHTGDTFGASAPSFIVEISDAHLDSMWYSLDGGLTNFFFTANGTIDQTAWAALSVGSVTITFYANNTLGNLASESVNVEKALLPPGDNFIIIIIIISIVSGATIITVVTVILLKKRKAGE